MAVIAILAAMLLSAFQAARSRAKYARWLTYKNNLRCDPNLIAYYTFERGEGNTLENKAVGQYVELKDDPEKLNGIIDGATWIKGGGRWIGKNTLQFDGFDDSVNCGDINTFDGLTKLSAEVWVKIEDLTSDRDILMKSEERASAQFLFWRDETGYYSGRKNTFSIVVYPKSGGSRRVEGASNASIDRRWSKQD